MKVDLKKLKVYTDLKKTKFEIVDFQETLAEFVYGNGGGFKACRLANKIADGKNGEVELSGEEEQMIISICDNSQMRCPFLTSIHELLEHKGIPTDKVKQSKK